MEMRRSGDTGQPPKPEGTRSQRRDEFRRRAESSRRNDAELSDQPMKRPRLDEIKLDEIKTASAEVRAELYTQAIERGEAKWQKYQQEAEEYKNKDKDTFEYFEANFDNNVIKLANYIVVVKSYSRNISGTYENEIDVKNGIIKGIYNRYFPPKSEEKLDFSEVVFNQLRLAMGELSMEISRFNLKCWYGNEIINENTEKAAELFFPEERGSDGKIKEGRKTFEAGEDGFIALAGTPTGQSKFYLLAQHPKAFPDKQVTSITVIRHSDGQIDIEYQFGSKLEQKELERELVRAKERLRHRRAHPSAQLFPCS
jgi:hypothetical protein